MPTTVTSSIGTTGRDYSTIQAWDDAAPANLVTSDQVWLGECYNDSEFVTDTVSIDGSTADATRYKHLTAAAGQSFMDHANVRTNALTYDQSKGVGIQRTSIYGNLLTTVTEPFVHVSRLQLHTGTNGGAISDSSGATFGMYLKDILVNGTRNGSNMVSTYGRADNVVVFMTGSAAITAFVLSFGAVAQGCAAIRTTDQSAAGTGFATAGGTTNVIRSCASFGFSTAAEAGSVWDTGVCSNNATDQSSGLPGSNNQHSVTFSATTPFTQAAVSGNDLRSIAGTSLINNGHRDATNAPNDISGTARSATPTIGHWEVVPTGYSPGVGALSLTGVAARLNYQINMPDEP